MSSWRRLLERMRDSPRCVGFTYDEAARVLAALGFRQASYGGSHRRWVLLRDGEPSVIIGLVDAGHGEIKPVYIKTMLQILDQNDLLPGAQDAE